MRRARKHAGCCARPQPSSGVFRPTRSGCTLRQSAQCDDGSELTYGELAAAAALLDVPKDVPLKDPADFRLIGESVPRLDVPVKTTGEAVFGIDAGPSDTRVAVVARCPVFGGSVRSFDPAPALAVSGVDEVVELESGVAVVAAARPDTSPQRPGGTP